MYPVIAIVLLALFFILVIPVIGAVVRSGQISQQEREAGDDDVC